jgi:dolichol-phosphate mannosyltransferase
VDDNSTDGTINVVNNFSKIYGNDKINLIVRNNERGVATAIKRSYDESKGIYLAALDADLCHDPKHLPEMLQLIKSGKADLVIGSRYVKGAEFTGKPWINHLASSIGQLVIWIVLGLRIKDTSNHFRMMRRDLYLKFANQLHPTGNVMIVEMLYRAKKLGAKIVEIPIIYRERRFGESKIKVWRETKVFFKTIFNIRFSE